MERSRGSVDRRSSVPAHQHPRIFSGSFRDPNGTEPTLEGSTADGSRLGLKLAQAARLKPHCCAQPHRASSSTVSSNSTTFHPARLPLHMRALVRPTCAPLRALRLAVPSKAPARLGCSVRPSPTRRCTNHRPPRPSVASGGDAATRSAGGQHAQHVPLSVRCPAAQRALRPFTPPDTPAHVPLLAWRRT